MNIQEGFYVEVVGGQYDIEKDVLVDVDELLIPFTHRSDTLLRLVAVTVVLDGVSTVMFTVLQDLR